MKSVKEDIGLFNRILCKLGLHKWSKNIDGWRVCLRPGCSAYDSHFGISGALRMLRENYTYDEIEEMTK